MEVSITKHYKIFFCKLYPNCSLQLKLLENDKLGIRSDRRQLELSSVFRISKLPFILLFYESDPELDFHENTPLIIDEHNEGLQGFHNHREGHVACDLCFWVAIKNFTSNTYLGPWVVQHSVLIDLLLKMLILGTFNKEEEALVCC